LLYFITSFGCLIDNGTGNGVALVNGIYNLGMQAFGLQNGVCFIYLQPLQRRHHYILSVSGIYIKGQQRQKNEEYATCNDYQQIFQYVIAEDCFLSLFFARHNR